MQYIVTISDNETHQQIIRDRFSDIGEYMDVCHRAQKAATADDPLLMGSHFFDHPEIALEFAKYAARNKPTYTVYLSSVLNVVTTEVPMPIVKKVSKDGVLPL